MEKQQTITAIRQAVDMGYTFFDTAEVYGTAEDPHINEELVGEALLPYRNQVVIATKFGLRFDFESGKVPLPLVPSEEVAGVMAELMQEGKITHWGISEANEKYLRQAHAVCPVTAVQNRYSMMVRSYETLFPTLEELGIGLVAFSPMANGFLTAQYGKEARFDARNDYRASMPQFTADAMDQNQELLRLLHTYAEKKHTTPAQISLAWMLCKKPWIVPIPGTRKVERMQENAGSAEVVLSEEEVEMLDTALDHIEMSSVYGVK